MGWGTRPRRKAVRLGLSLLGILAGVFALQVGLLAFPQILLSNKAEVGAVVVYYDGIPDPSVRDVALETHQRLAAGGFGNPNHPKRVFLFKSQRLYSLFARLTRVPSTAQGFGISFLSNTYVSPQRVSALGERTGQAPRYGVWEGDLAHTMAHEVAHLYMVDSIGRSAWSALPQWKQEGFPEYVANIGLIRGDSTASLPRRIGVLLDDEVWLGPRSWDRIHYEAGLLVEFLLDVRGLSLAGMVTGEVRRDEVYGDMMEWFRGQQEPAPRGRE